MLQADLDSLQSWSDTWLLKLEAGQIGPKPNRPKVKSTPNQIGPIFVVYYCQHAKLNSLNTIQQNI